MRDLTDRAIAELLAQHEALRDIMDRCEQLADELDAGHGSAEALTREVASLRLAFDNHNHAEERLLPIARRPGASGVNVGLVVTDHADEHRAMSRRIVDGPCVELRGVIASLRDHLATEDQYLVGSHNERISAQLNRASRWRRLG